MPCICKKHFFNSVYSLGFSHFHVSFTAPVSSNVNIKIQSITLLLYLHAASKVISYPRGIQIPKHLLSKSELSKLRIDEDEKDRFVSLYDPLDCLTPVICGLDASPPQYPSPLTPPVNDFAYLLRTVFQ